MSCRKARENECKYVAIVAIGFILPLTGWKWGAPITISQSTQRIQWTNQNSKEDNVADTKHGKTSASKSRLVLVLLLLTGRKRGESFFSCWSKQWKVNYCSKLECLKGNPLFIKNSSLCISPTYVRRYPIKYNSLSDLDLSSVCGTTKVLAPVVQRPG